MLLEVSTKGSESSKERDTCYVKYSRPVDHISSKDSTLCYRSNLNLPESRVNISYNSNERCCSGPSRRYSQADNLRPKSKASRHQSLLMDVKKSYLSDDSASDLLYCKLCPYCFECEQTTEQSRSNKLILMPKSQRDKAPTLVQRPKNKYYKPKAKSEIKRWNSVDSVKFIDSSCSSSQDLQCKKCKRVSISESIDVIYQTPLPICYDRPSPSQPAYAASHSLYLRTDQKISALRKIALPVKTSSFLDCEAELFDSMDVYDPSLPPIDIHDTPNSSNSVAETWQFETREDKKTYSSTSTLPVKSKIPRNPHVLVSIGTTLSEWYDAITYSSRLGWTLLLYLAIRSNYRPLIFARVLFQVAHRFHY